MNEENGRSYQITKIPPMSDSTLKRITDPAQMVGVTFSYSDPDNHNKTVFPVFYTLQNHSPPGSGWYPVYALFYGDQNSAKSSKLTDFSELSGFDASTPALLCLFYKSSLPTGKIVAGFNEGAKITTWTQNLMDKLVNISAYTGEKQWPAIQDFMTRPGVKTFSWVTDPDNPVVSGGGNNWIDNALTIGWNNTRGPWQAAGRYLQPDPSLDKITVSQNETPMPIFLENGVVGVNQIQDGVSRLGTKDQNGFYFSWSCYGTSTGKFSLEIAKAYPNTMPRSFRPIPFPAGEAGISFNVEDEHGHITQRKVYIGLAKCLKGGNTRFAYLADSAKELAGAGWDPESFHLQDFFYNVPQRGPSDKVQMLTFFFGPFSEDTIDQKFATEGFFEQVLGGLGKKLYETDTQGFKPLMRSEGFSHGPNQVWMWINDPDIPNLPFSDVSKHTGQSLNPRGVLFNSLAIRGKWDGKDFSFTSSLDIMRPENSYLRISQGLILQTSKDVASDNQMPLTFFEAPNPAHYFNSPRFPSVNTPGPITGVIWNGRRGMDLHSHSNGVYRLYVQLLNDSSRGFDAGRTYLVPTRHSYQKTLPVGLPGITDVLIDKHGDTESSTALVMMQGNLDLGQDANDKTMVDYWSSAAESDSHALLNKAPVLFDFYPYIFSPGNAWLLQEIAAPNNQGNRKLQEGVQVLNRFVDPEGKNLANGPERGEDVFSSDEVVVLPVAARIDLGTFPNKGLKIELKSWKDPEDDLPGISAKSEFTNYTGQAEGWVMAGLFSPESFFLSKDATFSFVGPSNTPTGFEADLFTRIKDANATGKPYGYWSQSRGLTFFDTTEDVGKSVWAYLGPIKDDFPDVPMMYYSGDPNFKKPANYQGPEPTWDLFENLVVARSRWSYNGWQMLNYLANKQPSGPRFFTGGGSSNPAALAPASRIRTPQGMLFTLGQKGAIDEWTITRSTGASNQPLSFSGLQQANPDNIPMDVRKMLHGLAYNNALMVISRKQGAAADPIATAFKNDVLSVKAGNETFSFEWDLVTKQAKPVMIVKNMVGAKLGELLKNSDYWLSLVSSTNDLHTLEQYFEGIVSKARAKADLYSDLIRVLDDPDWTGTLIFDCPLKYGQMSPDVQMLLGGVEGTLSAEFVIVGQNILAKKGPSPMEIVQNSISALIAYDPDEDQIVKQYQAPSVSTPSIFKTLKFNLKITDSRVAHFDARVALSIPTAFHRLMTLNKGDAAPDKLHKDAWAKNIVMVNGHYARDKNGQHGHIVFDSTEEQDLKGTSSARVVKQLSVQDMRLLPISSKTSSHNDVTTVIAHFTLDGMMQFNEVGGLDLFSFSAEANALPFYGYTFSIPTYIHNRDNTAHNGSIEWKPGLLRLSQDGGDGHVEPVEDSLLDDLPFRVTGFRGGGALSVKTQGMGGMTIEADEIPALNGHWQDAGTGLDFAIEVTAPVGHLGALPKTRHLLKNSILLGWAADGDSDKAGAIFIPPSGMSPDGSFNLQGVLKGSFESVKLTRNIEHAPITFDLELTGVSMHLLKLPVMNPFAKFGPMYGEDAEKYFAQSRLSIFGGNFGDSDMVENVGLGKKKKKKKKKGNVAWGHAKSPHKKAKGGAVVKTGIKEKEAEWNEFKDDPVKFMTRRLNPFNYMGIHFGHSSGIFHNISLHTDLDAVATKTGTAIDAAMLVLKDVPLLKDDFMKLLKENGGKIYHQTDFSPDNNNKSPYYVTYDPKAGLLIYIAMDLLCLEFSAIFQDSSFFGAQLKVPKITTGGKGRTPTAKLSRKIQEELEGLIIEFIYRKISEHLGEWALLVNLPAPLRVIKEGEFKFFLPSVGIQMWTDGSYKVSLGWPYANKQLSKMGIQIPIEGVPVKFESAVYFGKLNGRDLPGTYASYFANLFEFGYTATVGVEKEKKASLYYYKAYIQVGFTLEGFLGVPYAVTPHSGGTSAVSNNFEYYWFMGSVFVQGGLTAILNLKIIRATLSLKGEFRISAAFETAHSFYLVAKLSATVDIKIKILFIHIHIHKHFSFELFSKTFGNGPNASLEHPTPKGILEKPKGSMDALQVGGMEAAPSRDLAMGNGGNGNGGGLLRGVMDRVSNLFGKAGESLAELTEDLSNKQELDQLVTSLVSVQLLQDANTPHPLQAWMSVLPTVEFDPEPKKQLVIGLVMESGKPDNATAPKTYTEIAKNGVAGLVAWLVKMLVRGQDKSTVGAAQIQSELPASLQVSPPVRSSYANDPDFETATKNYHANMSMLVNLFAIQEAMAAWGSHTTNWFTDMATKWLEELSLTIVSEDNTKPGAGISHVPFPLPQGVEAKWKGNGLDIPFQGLQEHQDDYMVLAAHAAISEIFQWQLQSAGKDLTQGFKTPDQQEWYQIVYDAANILTRYFMHGAREQDMGFYAHTGQQVKSTVDVYNSLVMQVSDGQKAGFKSVSTTGRAAVTWVLPNELELPKLSLTTSELLAQFDVSNDKLTREQDKVWHFPMPHKAAIGANKEFVRLPEDLIAYADHHASTWAKKEAEQNFKLFSGGSAYVGNTSYAWMAPISLHGLESGGGHFRLEALNPDNQEFLSQILRLPMGTVSQVDFLIKQDGGGYKAIDKPVTVTRSNLAVSDLHPSTGGLPSASPVNATVKEGASPQAIHDFLTLVWEGSVIHEGGYLFHTDYPFKKLSGGKGQEKGQNVAGMPRITMALKFKDGAVPTNLVNSLLFAAAPQNLALKLSPDGGTDFIQEVKPTTQAGSVNWDVTMPPSDIHAHNASDEFISSLYHLVQYQTTLGTNPVSDTAWSDPHGHHRNESDLLEFHLRDELATGGGDPYAIVGRDAILHLRLVDVFGNAMNDYFSSGAEKVKYSDLLESPLSWPGVSMHYEVKTNVAQPTAEALLQLQLHYTPLKASDYDDHADFVKAKVEMQAKYKKLVYQINDVDTATVHCSLWKNQPAAGMASAELLSALRQLATDVAANPAASQDLAPKSMAIPFNQLPDPVLFELQVAIQLSRKDDASLYDADMLAALPAVKSIRTTIHAGTDHPTHAQSQGLRHFASDFEQAMKNVGNGTQLKLAQGPAHHLSKDHAHSVWVFKWQGGGLKPSFGHGGNVPAYGYWAPQPMSHVLVPTEHGHEDLDAKVRSFMRNLHLIQSPEKDATMAESGDFKALMQLKRDLGDSVTGSLKRILLPAGTHSGDQAPQETLEYFTEQMYTALTHDYGTTTLASFPMDMANGNTIDNGPATHHAPYFLGQVGPKQGNSDQAFTFSTAQVRTPKVIHPGSPDHTNFMVTAQKAGSKAYLEQELSIDLHSFDYRYHESEERFGLLPSTWLTFLVPDDKKEPTTKIALSQPKIPLPYRQFPNSPRLISQKAVNNDPRVLNWKQLKSELTWDYELSLAPPQAAQDKIYLYVQFNNTWDAPSNFGPDPLTWQEINADAKKKAFVENLELFNGKIEGVLAGDGSNVGDVLPAAKLIVENWPTTVWGTTNAVDKVTMGPQDLLLEIRSTQPGQYELTVVDFGGRVGAGVSVNGIPAPLAKGAHCPIHLQSGALTVEVKGLSIVNHQLARTYAFVERNSELVPGQTTNQLFVYQSPVVKFASPLVPYQDMVKPISMSSPAADIVSSLEELLKEFKPDSGLGLDQDVKLQLTVGKLLQVGDTKGDDAPHALDPLRLWQADFKVPFLVPGKLSSVLTAAAGSCYAVNFNLSVFSAVKASGGGWTPLLHLPNVQWKAQP